MADAQQRPPAGWLADPWGVAELRYWDGTRWTEHTHTARANAPRPVGDRIAGTATRAWEHTAKASSAARAAAAPVVAGTGAQAKKLWRHTSSAISSTAAEIRDKREAAAGAAAPPAPSAAPVASPPELTSEAWTSSAPSAAGAAGSAAGGEAPGSAAEAWVPSAPSPTGPIGTAAELPEADEASGSAAEPSTPPVPVAGAGFADDAPADPSGAARPSTAQMTPAAAEEPAAVAPAAVELPATTPATAVPMRRPLTQHLASVCWAIAGVILVVFPFVVAALVRGQYEQWRADQEGTAPSNLADDLGIWDGAEQLAEGVGSPALSWLTTAYVVFGVISLALYAWIVFGVITGRAVPRVLGTVLAGLSIPLLLVLGMAQSRLVANPWFEIQGLTFANACVWIVLLLHLAGVLFVWLPPTTKDARARQAARVARRKPSADATA